MRHASPLANINASSQSDLVDNALNKEQIREETMPNHPLCLYGFCEIGSSGLMPMNEETISEAVRSLQQSRPTARLLDVTPVGIEYVEKPITVSSPLAFRMTMKQKADAIASEFVRNPQVCGFRISTEGLEGDNPRPLVSIIVYESKEYIENPQIPVDIKVVYRPNF